MTPRSQPAVDSLRELLDGLSVRAMDVRLALNRPAPLGPLTTATARGLSGHLLAVTRPKLVRRWFKPGQGNNQPSACLFQPVRHAFSVSSEFDFRIHTWDPPGELLPALASALKNAPDREFGESGARVQTASFEPEERLRFEGVEPMSGGILVQFLTAVRLKSDTGWISENEMSLAHLVHASIRRLNLLSDCYGNGRTLTSCPWMEFAEGLPEIRRSLQWDRPRRRSTSQDADLALSGVVGEIHLAALPHPILELLSATTLFHVGQKTVEGCGCFRLIPVR